MIPGTPLQIPLGGGRAVVTYRFAVVCELHEGARMERGQDRRRPLEYRTPVHRELPPAVCPICGAAAVVEPWPEGARRELGETPLD